MAAQRLWERYFDDLVRLARPKLGAIPRREADEEDIALERLPQLLSRRSTTAGSLGSMTGTTSGGCW